MYDELLEDITAWENYYREKLLNLNNPSTNQNPNSDMVATERAAFLAGRASSETKTVTKLPSLLELIPTVESVSAEHSLIVPTNVSDLFGCTCDPVVLLTSEEEWRQHFAMELISDISSNICDTIEETGR